MDPTSTTAPRRRLRRSVTWTLFILVCATMAATHIRLQKEKQAREEAFFASIRGDTASDRQTLQLLFQGQGKDCRSDLERQLNRGRPFEVTLDQGGMQGAIFKDPDSGTEYRLLFAGERLLTYKIIRHTTRLASRQPPQGTRSWRLAEGARQCVAALGAPAWLLGLLAFLLLPSRRRLLATLLIAIAMLCTLSWMLRPAESFPSDMPRWPLRIWHSWPPPTWFRLLSLETPWGFGLVLLLAGGLACWWVRSRRPPYPHCSTCGYNLTANLSGVCPECGTPTVTGRREVRKPSGSVIRTALGALAVCSFLLCVMTVILWARGHDHWDWLDCCGAGLGMKFFSTAGGEELRISNSSASFDLTFGSTRIAEPVADHEPPPSSWRLEWRTLAGGWQHSLILAAPHWFVTIGSLALPLCWVGRLRAGRRRLPTAQCDLSVPRP